MVASCGDEAREPVCLMPDTTVVRPGDIVFRRGGGFTSHAVVTLDAHGYYSHVGMVVDTAGRMMVVHAVPGEPDFEGDPDRVKLDSLQKFFSSLYTDCGEVCRVSDEKVAGKAAEVAKQVLRRNTDVLHRAGALCVSQGRAKPHRQGASLRRAAAAQEQCLLSVGCLFLKENTFNH